MINNATSFWKFIQKHPVEIPIIQRDYAQGRLGKEYIRRDFLANQKKALDDYLKDDTSVLKLDFVYGTEHNGKLYPLDGQQRLTTLWLLHWYIALKIQKLGEVGDTLTRFSYETRVSSREFCKEGVMYRREFRGIRWKHEHCRFHHESYLVLFLMETRPDHPVYATHDWRHENQ